MDDDMKLPEGKICNDCVHIYRCSKIYGVQGTETGCDFAPSRFQHKKKPCEKCADRAAAAVILGETMSSDRKEKEHG